MYIHASRDVAAVYASYVILCCLVGKTELCDIFCDLLGGDAVLLYVCMYMYKKECVCGFSLVAMLCCCMYVCMYMYKKECVCGYMSGL
jgi:hypothetical protein